jgi:hypothetical protein
MEYRGHRKLDNIPINWHAICTPILHIAKTETVISKYTVAFAIEFMNPSTSALLSCSSQARSRRTTAMGDDTESIIIFYTLPGKLP